MRAKGGVQMGVRLLPVQCIVNAAHFYPQKTNLCFKIKEGHAIILHIKSVLRYQIGPRYEKDKMMFV